MSAKVPPRSTKGQKPSCSVHQDDGILEDGRDSAEHSRTSDSTHKDVDSTREAKPNSRRASQLPQRATARQSSMRVDSMKVPKCSGTLYSERIRDSLRKAEAEMVARKNSASSKELRGITHSSRTDINQMLPPTKLERSFSTQRQGIDRASTQFQSQRAASNVIRGQPGEPHTMGSRPSSLETKAMSSMTDFIPKPVVAQACRKLSGNAQPAPESPKTELQTVEPNGHGAERISGYVRKNEFNTSLAIQSISSHGRSRNQQVTDLSKIAKLSLIEVKPKDVSGSYQHRPPFSTMQQHFSPKKTLKAPTASFLVQPSSAHIGTHELSNETVQIQTELAHLHLLLCSASQVQNQWERDAKQCLQTRFERLRQRHVQLNGLAQSYQTFLNYSVLISWCDNMTSIEFAEKVQLLSHNVLEISALMESRGRYTCVLSDFELWLARARRIQDTRIKVLDAPRQDIEFIEGIGDDWKVEVAALEMKLTSFSRELRSVGKLQGNAFLARLLLSLQRVVVNLLDELGALRGIENDLMVQDTLWIEAMVGELTSNTDGGVMPVISTSDRGIWHTGSETYSGLELDQ